MPRRQERPIQRPTNLNCRNKSESPANSRLRNETLDQCLEQQIELNKLEQDLIKKSGLITSGHDIIHASTDDFHHEFCLGFGTCGVVNRMRHKYRDDLVMAVKQMRLSSNCLNEKKRILMDLDVITKCSGCPNIIQCMGIFFLTSEVWICMEVMSTCLDKLLRNCKKSFPEYVLGKVTVSIVKALNYLKVNHNMMHRDIKPSNMLLSANGEVKLCDFGISGQLKDSIAKSSQLGCIGYMAPERLEKRRYDVRADIWSLGISLIELATGCFPYNEAQVEIAVVNKIINDPPPTLPFDSKLSEIFRSFVEKCLTRCQNDRPKYNALMRTQFYLQYDVVPHDVKDWYTSLASYDQSKESNTYQQFSDKLYPTPASSPASTVTPSSEKNLNIYSIDINTKASSIPTENLAVNLLPDRQLHNPVLFQDECTWTPSSPAVQKSRIQFSDESDSPCILRSTWAANAIFVTENIIRSHASSNYVFTSPGGSYSSAVCQPRPINSIIDIGKIDKLTHGSVSTSTNRNLINGRVVASSISNNYSPPILLRDHERSRPSPNDSRRNGFYHSGCIDMPKDHCSNNFPDSENYPSPEFDFLNNSEIARTDNRPSNIHSTPPLHLQSIPPVSVDKVSSPHFSSSAKLDMFSHRDLNPDPIKLSEPSFLCRLPRSVSAKSRKVQRSPACRLPANPYNVQVATSGSKPVFAFIANTEFTTKSPTADCSPTHEPQFYHHQFFWYSHQNRPVNFATNNLDSDSSPIHARLNSSDSEKPPHNSDSISPRVLSNPINCFENINRRFDKDPSLLPDLRSISNRSSSQPATIRSKITL